jgi:hypothetical protein
MYENINIDPNGNECSKCNNITSKTYFEVDKV